MKESNRLQMMNKLTLTAITLPVVVLLGIIGGVVASDDAALAEKTAASTRISQDINEDYFTEGDRLAQAGGMLEPRQDDDSQEEEAEDENSDVNEGNDEVEADSSQCSNVYLEDDLRIDFNNDRTEVLKLQSFLKTFEGYDYVSLTGNFDQDTLQAVESFQSRYAEDVLEPWGYEADEATGYVYITTKKKINEIYCDEQFLLSKDQQDEIRNYREKLNDWRSQGASFETPKYLADYYGYSQSGSADSADVSSEGGSDPDSDNGDTVSVEETPAGEGTTTATSATSTEDDGGFFDWLFGGDDSATTSTSTTDDSDEEEATTTAEGDEGEDEEAGTTSTSTATSGLDQMAAGIYTGVNGIVNFLLSPTVLLIVLVVLILLLIATLIETDEEEAQRQEAEKGSDDSDESLAWSSGDDTEDGDDDTEGAVTDAEVVETESEEESEADNKEKEGGKDDNQKKGN